MNRFSDRALAALLALPLVLVGCGGNNLIDYARNPFGSICGLIVLIVDVIALVEVWKSARSDGDKLLWSLLIVFFPVLGLIIYYLFGRR